jgi:hypothetical protein
MGAASRRAGEARRSEGRLEPRPEERVGLRGAGERRRAGDRYGSGAAGRGDDARTRRGCGAGGDSLGEGLRPLFITASAKLRRRGGGGGCRRMRWANRA